MKIAKATATRTWCYRHWEPGDRVRPCSSRSPLPRGEWVVTAFRPPRGDDDDRYGTLFVDGARNGFSAEYVTSAEDEPALPPPIEEFATEFVDTGRGGE